MKQTNRKYRFNDPYQIEILVQECRNGELSPDDVEAIAEVCQCLQQSETEMAYIAAGRVSDAGKAILFPELCKAITNQTRQKFKDAYYVIGDKLVSLGIMGEGIPFGESMGELNAILKRLRDDCDSLKIWADNTLGKWD